MQTTAPSINLDSPGIAFSITMKALNALALHAPPNEEDFPRADYPELWEAHDNNPAIWPDDYAGKIIWRVSMACNGRRHILDGPLQLPADSVRPLCDAMAACIDAYLKGRV